MLLTEMPWFQHKTLRPPIRILARHNGKYVRPITAYAMDMRLEDNPATKGLSRSKDHWIARHPLDDLYIICHGQELLHSSATRQQVHELIRDGKLPKDVIQLPTERDAAWWEWVMSLGRDGEYNKAAKRPRPFEPTPEQVDEAGQQPSIKERLQQVFRVKLP